MQSFSKNERLTNKQIIDDLFATGKKFHIYPFTVVQKSIEQETGFPARVLFSVPKKKMRKAVDRNKIKRLMRESYRKNKEEHFYLPLKKMKRNCVFAIVYSANKILSYNEIEKKIISVLNRLIMDYEKNIS